MNSLFKIGKGRRERKPKKGANQENSKKQKTRSSLIRVQQEFDELELPDNVKLNLPDPEYIGNFEILIKLNDGLWKDGKYTFNFKILNNYPITSPKVICKNKIYHPNIDLNGSICLNILKNDWRPIMGIQDIIHGLLFLFYEPNGSDPLNLDAAKIYRENYPQFKKNVEKSLYGGIVDGTQFEPMKK